MNGIKFLSGFIGLAWVLGGAGSLTTNLASGKARDDAAIAQRTEIQEELTRALASVDEEIASTRERGEANIARTTERLEEDQAALDLAGVEIRSQIETTQASLAAESDLRKVTRLEAQIVSQQKRLARRTTAPQNRRDASAEKVDKAKAELTQAIAALEASKQTLNKGAETKLAAVSTMQAIPVAGAWWKGVIALVIGVLGMALSFVLRATPVLHVGVRAEQDGDDSIAVEDSDVFASAAAQVATMPPVIENEIAAREDSERRRQQRIAAFLGDEGLDPSLDDSKRRDRGRAAPHS
ncbi:MAG: hypothetical protein ABIJ09_22065 [Pseudomonadota bacterium]